MRVVTPAPSQRDHESARVGEPELTSNSDDSPATPVPTLREGGATLTGPESNAPMTIFLSYSRDSAQLAQTLAQELKNNGNTVWLDLDDLTPGSHWAAEIKNAVSKSDGVIFLVTRQFAKSDHAALEVALAASTQARSGKALIPVRIDRTRTVPPLLDQYAWIDGIDLDANALAREITHALTVRRAANQAQDMMQAGEAIDASTAVLRREIEREAERLNRINLTGIWRFRTLLLPLISGVVGAISSVIVNWWSQEGQSKPIILGTLVATAILVGTTVIASVAYIRTDRKLSRTETRAREGGSGND